MDISRCESSTSRTSYNDGPKYDYTVVVGLVDSPNVTDFEGVTIVLHGDDEKSDEMKMEFDSNVLCFGTRLNKTFYIKQQCVKYVKAIEIKRDDKGSENFLKIKAISITNDQTGEEIVFPILRCIHLYFHRRFTQDDTSLPHTDKGDGTDVVLYEKELSDSVNEMMRCRDESAEVQLKNMNDVKNMFDDKTGDCAFRLLRIDQDSFSQSPLFKFRVEFQVQKLEYPTDESKLQSLVMKLQTALEKTFNPLLNTMRMKVVGVASSPRSREPMSVTLLIQVKDLTELVDTVEWRHLGLTVNASMKIILSCIVFLIARLEYSCTEFSIRLSEMRFNQGKPVCPIGNIQSDILHEYLFNTSLRIFLRMICEYSPVDMYSHQTFNNPKGPSTREDELNWKRNKYKLRVLMCGLPPQCSEVPMEEKFSFSYGLLNLTLPFAINTVCGCLRRCGSSPRIKSQKGFKRFLKQLDYPKPSDMNRWKSDSAFGVQRFAGVNNTTIHRCTWDNFPEIAINKDEKWVRDGIAEKSLYFVDHSILKGIKEGYDVAPIALFSMKTGQLLPVAIQLFPNQPVFTPDDSKYTWIMAKMWFNNADAQVHQSIYHLGFTHLIMEGIVVVTNTQLAPAHPVFKLLAPHFLYLIDINANGIKQLLMPDGYFDENMAVERQGCLELIKRKHQLWRMDVDGTLPEDLKARGIDDQIPGYHFQEDGLQLYAAIQNYVRNYLNIYYTNSIAIANDNELQAWRNEMTTPAADGGLGINGVPGTNGQFAETEQIVTTLTSIIYTCSVGHAAANFKQYDEYAFPPNYPSRLCGNPPSDKNVILREKDIFDALQDKSSISETLVLTKILSERGTEVLGNFEVKYIYDERALQVVDGFCRELKQIDLAIEQRNVDRAIPYPYLQPSRVPNSISI